MAAVVRMAVGEGDVRSGLPREEDGGARRWVEGGGGTNDEREEEEEDVKSRESWRGGMAMGSLMPRRSRGGTCSRRGAAVIAIAAAMAKGRSAARTRSSRIAKVRKKKTRGFESMPRGEGRAINRETRRNLDRGGTRGR
jgi:hypothetical protein